LFRRLASFAGGFDLEAAQVVGAGDGLERHQVLDQLALLVDKSLVAAEESQAATRYRLLETIRQYAAEKLGESSGSMNEAPWAAIDADHHHTAPGVTIVGIGTWTPVVGF
jgi:predicted ATPase